MVTDTILRRAAARLTNSETPLLDARVLLSCAVGEDSRTLFRGLTEEESARFGELVCRRAAGEPVAYIVGEKEFMGYSFRLNRDCLIPRPDTETVVESIIGLNLPPEPKILDLCCGSGCIGLSLAMFMSGAYVCLCDISDGALKMTVENARLYGLEGRTEILRLDVLKEPLPRGFDIIVSNPPYIPSSVTDGLEVSKYEPRLALDGGEDGLDFYRAIIPKAGAALKINGILACEIGFDQGDAVRSMFEDNGFVNISVKKDYGGNDRLVMGEKYDNKP